MFCNLSGMTWHAFFVDRVIETSLSECKSGIITYFVQIFWLLSGSYKLSSTWVYEISHVHSASCPATLCSKNFNLQQYRKTFQPDSSSYHTYRQHWPLPFYTTFSGMAEGHKFQREQHLLGSFSGSDHGEIWFAVETIQSFGVFFYLI